MIRIIDKLAWIYIENRKILSTLSKGKMVWYIPGGKREAGENDAEALIREIREELAVDLVPESICYMGAFTAPAHGEKEEVMVKMFCYTAGYRGVLTASGEIEQYGFFTSADKLRSSQVDQLIFDWLIQHDRID